MNTQIKFIGYAPDADPTIPGVFTSCSSVIPTLRGFKAAPTPVATTLPALAASCQGATLAVKVDNTTRFIAATGTNLYEESGGSWSDVTRSTGGNYGATSDLRWNFAQYNDTTLATVKTDTLQFSTTSGKFENVTGAPMASIVETVNDFIFLFDTSETTYGDCPNRWWCAAEGDFTDWTPDVNTNCYTGLLTSSPGSIRAAKRFGDNIIAYKDRAMYVGYFAGNPVGWSFSEIPGDTGALSSTCVVNVGTLDSPKHIFMGYNDFFEYDGARPIPLGANVLKETVFQTLNRTYSYVSTALHDYLGNRIFFFYPTSDSVYPDSCVVFNYKTNQWGRDDRSVEAVVSYISSGMTYDNLGSTYGTYDALPSTSYDTSFYAPGVPQVAFFDLAHTLYTLNGSPSSSSITLGDYGDDDQFTLLTRVKPRFLTAPSTATLFNYYKNNLGDSVTLDGSVGFTEERFDLMREARWHRVRMDFTGDMEITGLIADAVVGGYG